MPAPALPLSRPFWCFSGCWTLPDGFLIPVSTCIPTQSTTVEASSRDLGLSVLPLRIGAAQSHSVSAMLGSTISTMSLNSQDVPPILASPSWPRLFPFLVTSLDYGGISKAWIRPVCVYVNKKRLFTLWPTLGQGLGAPESRGDGLQHWWGSVPLSQQAVAGSAQLHTSSALPPHTAQAPRTLWHWPWTQTHCCPCLSCL